MSNILDKVRALLSKTIENGASEAEALAAMQMAQKLMIKHAISADELLVSKNDLIESDFEDLRLSYERTKWVWDMLSVLSKTYTCKTLRKQKWCDTKNKIVYVYEIHGFAEDVAVVKNLTSQLVPWIRRIGLEKSKFIVNPYVKNRYYNSYLDGFISGLNQKLNFDKGETLQLTDEERSQYQLIAVKKTDLINEKIAQMKLKTAKPTPQNIDPIAWSNGYVDGKEYNELNKRLK